MKTVFVGAAIALVLGLGLSAGLSTKQVVPLEVVSGSWSTSLMLVRETEDCLYLPNGNGSGYISCSESEDVLESVGFSGECNSDFCDPIQYPETPDDWVTSSSVKIKNENTFTVTLRMNSGKIIERQVSVDRFNELIPQFINNQIEGKENNFGYVYI